MSDHDALAIGREVLRTVEGVNTLRHAELSGLPVEIAEIHLSAPILIDVISEMHAVWRELAGTRLPLRVGHPGYLFAGNIEQGNILESAFLIRGEQNLTAIG